jgi:tRNA(fMet)-specific endonuclease VapC
MRYPLDTNVCVDCLNGCFPSVTAKPQSLALEEVAISVVAVAELRFGAAESARAETNHRLLDLFLDDIAVLDLDRDAARAYESLRAPLERSGTPIGANDMLIAAQALAAGAVLVSANLDELRRVAGLAVQSWR